MGRSEVREIMVGDESNYYYPHTSIIPDMRQGKYVLLLLLLSIIRRQLRAP